MNGFTQNAEFDDWKSFVEAKKAYELATKTVLVTRGSHVLKGNNETVEKFRYNEVIYEWKAGTQRKTQSNGHRASSTYKINCLFMVSVNSLKQLSTNEQQNVILCQHFRLKFNSMATHCS